MKVIEDIFNPNGPPPAQHTMVAPANLAWGDPSPGLPAGARVAVVSGDPSQPQPFVLRAQMPAEMRHSFATRTAATIQVHGIGPFAITYVNPADDPNQK